MPMMMRENPYDYVKNGDAEEAPREEPAAAQDET